MGRSFSSPSASRTANSSRRGSRARRNRLVIYPHHDMGVGSADTFVGCMLLLGSFLSSLDYMRITWFTCCGRWASCYIFSLSLLNTLVYTCIYTYSLEELYATINSKLTPKIGFKKKRIWYQYTLTEEWPFPWPAAGVTSGFETHCRKRTIPITHNHDFQKQIYRRYCLMPVESLTIGFCCCPF